MNRKVDVISIGDLNIDIITEPITRFPEKETSFIINRLSITPGGNAANFAAATARLGLRTRFMGLLGKDPISHWLIEKMQEYGVECCVKIRDDVIAGITYCITYKNGTRQFIGYLGSNRELSLKDINLNLVSEAKHLHRSGFWWTHKMMGEPTSRLFKYARDHGVQTSLDIAWDPQGWTDERVEKVYRSLEHITVFFANDRELRYLTRKKGLEEGAEFLLELGTKIVAIHLGEKGSMIVTKGRLIKAPAFNIEPVNPTGSGDIYNAAFIYGLVKGWSIEKTVNFANAAAALHIAKIEAVYPSKTMVESFMKRTAVKPWID